MGLRLSNLYIVATAMFLSAALASANGVTRYVNVNNPSPAAPYTSWLTAATNIQTAVAVAGFGDSVLVTNGIYQSGGDSFNGSNRVDDLNSVPILSVNGPAVTTIVGYQVPGTTNGAAAVRCVYLREFGTLSGFTLAGGATTTGSYAGGVMAESLCVVSNCVIIGNAGYYAGGVYSGNGPLLVNCMIASNTATYEGGNGGGVYGCIISNCVVKNNYAASGGGQANGTAYNCLFTGNGSTNSSGGTSGGAAYLSTLVNCTVVGNFSHGLGALDGCTATNSIIYYNFNGTYADCYQCQLACSCTPLGPGTSSLPPNCLSNAPGFVDLGGGNYHLNPYSRCIDTGTNGVATNTVDLDGNPRLVGLSVDMGCYENQSPFSGLAHYVSLWSTNATAPYTNWPTAATNIQDAVAVAQPGELVLLDDGTYSNGRTILFGSEGNRVVLTNGVTLAAADGPLGAAIVGGPQTRCVYVGSNSVLYGLTITNGQTAGSGDLTNEESGGGLWCQKGGVVSNCIVTANLSQVGHGGGIFGGAIFNTLLTNNFGNYGGGAAGANLFNCLLYTNSASGNYGGGVYQCTASNCTLAGNWAYFAGGGAYQSVLRNCYLYTNTSSLGAGGADSSQLYGCIVTNNQGSGGGTINSTNYSCRLLNNTAKGNGGGAQNGYLFDCIVTGNHSVLSGGGAYNSVVVNCTLTGNSAGGGGAGGGVANCQTFNSIIYGNTVTSGSSSNTSGGNLYYCCTAPSGGSGCFINPPVYVNAAAGDFHQASNSPTINGGDNFYTGTLYPVAQDFDGNARTNGGTVDVGAYEYQGANQTVVNPPIPWLRQYGLATDGSANFVDSDGDGMNNWQEWIAGTSPIDATSVLHVNPPPATGNAGGITVTWQSVSGITYYLQRGSDFTASPPLTTIQSGIAGRAGTTSYTDTTATNEVPYFYRVGVQ